jgi:glutathione synthase/RimK-type ligase-like ATP-grasp enzyme
VLYFLSDENFNGDIIRGLRLRNPHLDLLRVQDVGLLEVDDPEVLAWAAANHRILLTHDRTTMPDFAYERILAEQAMSGLFVVNDSTPIRNVIDELLLINEYSEQAEWSDLVIYLPL